MRKDKTIKIHLQEKILDDLLLRLDFIYFSGKGRWTKYTPQWRPNPP